MWYCALRLSHGERMIRLIETHFDGRMVFVLIIVLLVYFR